MDIVKSDQRNSQVLGPQAGRDVNYYASKPTGMTRLIEKYEQEAAKGTVLNDIIRQLRHLASPVSYDVRGVEEKLDASGRNDLIKKAMHLKEIAAKELIRAPNSESAQQIYALVLGEMCANFSNLITPLIMEGKSRAEVDAAIHDLVINPAYESLETNPLCLSKNDIMGLYYFLAGNCHIAWDI